MKCRNQRTLKTGSSKRKASVDVSPSTSLPPLVEGPLRCFLRVTISRLLWTVHKQQSPSFVRLRWWGETSNETHFFPRDGSLLSQKNIKTTARFAVRCGPKQFTSYLTDMGSLVLDVLTKADHLPMARVQVSGVSRLSLSHPISGFYPIVSLTSEKLGELQVSLHLEPLTEAYESSSDINTKVPEIATLTMPSKPKSLSAACGTESVGGSGKNTPRGKDLSHFQRLQKDNDKGSEENPSSQESCGQTTNDILSILSERGNKLRDAMVLSALKCDMDSAPAVKDFPLLLPQDNIVPPFKPVSSPPGTFLQNILHADSSLKQCYDDPDVSDIAADIDSRAINILLGSPNTSPPPLLDRDCFSPDCLSGHSSVCVNSELGDPQYDQSLLENLFYKTPMSDTRPEDTQTKGHRTSQTSKSPLKQMNGSPNSEHQHCMAAAEAFPGMSEEHLAFLNMMRVAVVTIETLTVDPTLATRKPLSKGKPPHSHMNQKCTYFVEYMFPEASTASRHVYGKGGGEVTRVVSSKVDQGVVKFLHCSMFPVDFSTATVAQWWETNLVFKVFTRRSDQKKPALVGKAVHSLRELLQSRELSQSVVLPVQSLERNCENSATHKLGPLKVSLGLATDRRVATCGKTKSKLTWRDPSPSPIPSPPKQTSCGTQLGQTDRVSKEFPPHFTEDSRINSQTTQQLVEPFSHSGQVTSPHGSHQHVGKDPEVLLHTLLMVPDGKNFNYGPVQAPNIYLNCKMFWCNDMTRSVVSWGQASPSFNFAQVTPVSLTKKLLERMQNNVMVIEVWQKTGSLVQDRLLGLVKLPLHQFYMSFRDPNITQLLLKGHYPVLGVDCYMPVIDLFSGSCKGNLRVLLAMGTSQQIVALQRARDEEYSDLSHLVKPVHLLDHYPHPAAKANTMIEHVFVMRVEKVNGLTPVQSTVWGEADCYIQYSFPCQDGDCSTVDQDLIEGSANLKQFRTIATLCIPDPMFGHTETHVLVVPETVPVQRLLLSSLSSRGLNSGGGVQFEVWCRYYYPNVRDQLVAKGLLPLSKLCGMVTMQKHPYEPQKFSLPLIPKIDGPTGHQPQTAGILDVSIRYKHRPVRSEAQTGRGAASRVVTLVVKVHRASGLQAAARFWAEQDEMFGYFANVGMNTYVTVQLSFAPDSDRRSTRIIARTFCPEFDHHTELSCDLLLHRSSGKTCSLAELLEEASAVFTLWNKDHRKGVTFSRPKDVMLGTVEIPLVDLLQRRTGISGWFGVYVSSSECQHTMVGGLEISVNFAHHSDRENVIKAAQGLGWIPLHRDYAMDDDENSSAQSTKTYSLTLSMPRVWLPLHCLLLPGQTDLLRSTYCYFRYKFYEQEAFCSQMKHPTVIEGEDGRATVSFEGSRRVELNMTQPLLWYLREERLEVQVWVAFNKDKTRKPTDTDRLLGSAFVDLCSLAKMSKQKLTLSGVYPLFKRSAADLQGAALRVHVTLAEDAEPWEASSAAVTQMDSDSHGELSPDEVGTSPGVPLPAIRKKTTASRQENKSPTIMSDVMPVRHSEDSFPVTVVVDRAMHQNLKSLYPQLKRPTTDLQGAALKVHITLAEDAVPQEASAAAVTQGDFDSQGELSRQEVETEPQDPSHKKITASRQENTFPTIVSDMSVPHSDTSMEDSFHVTIVVERAMHLSLKSCPVAEHSEGTPSSCVSYTTADSAEPVFTAVIANTDCPVWDHQHECRLSKQLLVDPQLSLVFKVWHKGEVERVLGFASVDLSPLVCGFRSSYGWYNITDFSGQCHGQIKVSVTPLKGIHDLQAQRTTVNEESTKTPPGLPATYLTTAAYSSFRSHISRYTEQKMLSPERTEQLFSKGLKARDSHAEHMDKVRLYHQSLQEQTASYSACNSSAVDNNPSSSFLFSTLRNTQSELDNMQRYFRRKLVTPTFQSVVEDTGHNKCEDERDTEIESVQFNEENNKVIHGFRQHGVKTPQRSSTTPRHGDTESVSPSPPPKASEDYASEDSEELEEPHKQHCNLSEDESEDETDEDKESETCIRDMGVDTEEEDDEDYEDVVVKLRHLNEVSSLTDKTSPWTSIQSDPDTAFPESLEVPEELGLSHDDGEQRQPNRDCSEKQESVIFNEANSNGSDVVLHKEPDPHCHPSEQTNDAAAIDEPQPQASVPVDVPNFFLPSHQLEASMRAIQLAPSFSMLPSDEERISSGWRSRPRRGRPLRSDLSPASRKRESERIAKIFANQFD